MLTSFNNKHKNDKKFKKDETIETISYYWWLERYCVIVLKSKSFY